MASSFDASALRYCVAREGGTSRYTFSFGAWHDAARLGFGALRVLNEEWLPPGRGIPLHSHENMEILTIALAGAVQHQDSRGTRHVVAPGEIHLLSAGLGVAHREQNASLATPAHYLQAWIIPRSLRTPTRYGHGVISDSSIDGRFVLAAGPAASGSVVEINQDAYVSVIRLRAGATAAYRKHVERNGVYSFLVGGRVHANDELLAQGDGLGVTQNALAFAALDVSTLLCFEVPLRDYQL